MMDETSQPTEHAAVTVIARVFGRLNEVYLIRDIKQTHPFESSDAELRATIKEDLMSRLIASGVPCTTLFIQYRMHPHITGCVHTSSIMTD